MSVTGARGASGRPPVSGRPCVGILLCPVLPMMSPPMMMHTHTGASLSVIACVCYSWPSCPPVFLWGVGIITRKRLKHTGARERACEPVAPPVSCPPDDVDPDDDAHTYRSEPVGHSLCVLFLSPLSPVFLCGVGIITRKRLKHTGTTGARV